MNKQKFRVIEGNKEALQHETAMQAKAFFEKIGIEKLGNYDYFQSLDDISPADIAKRLDLNNIPEDNNYREQILEFYTTFGDNLIAHTSITVFRFNTSSRVSIRTDFCIPKRPTVMSYNNLIEQGFTLSQEELDLAILKKSIPQETTKPVTNYQMEYQVVLPSSSQPTAEELFQREQNWRHSGGLAAALINEDSDNSKLRDVKKDIKRIEAKISKPQAYNLKVKLNWKTDPIPENISPNEFAQIILNLQKELESFLPVIAKDFRESLQDSQNEKIRAHYNDNNWDNPSSFGLMPKGSPRSTSFKESQKTKNSILKYFEK